MKNKTSDCILVEFDPSYRLPVKVKLFLEDFFDVVVCNCVAKGKSQWVGYALTNFSPKKLESAALKQHIELPSYQIKVLREEDWLNNAVASFDSFETGRFYVCSADEKPEDTTNIVLKINAATAFGSNHQTTCLCLNALSYLFDLGAKHAQILDMGTGTGILSVAAAKIWRADKPKIMAADIDPEAVRVTTKNATLNRVSKNIQTACGDGFNTPEVLQNKPYDIILANILARPLIDMSQALKDSLSVGGHAVLSGFIDGQEDWVADAYKAQGLRVQKKWHLDHWHALLIERKK